jgi:Fe-S-cluster containining protein
MATVSEESSLCVTCGLCCKGPLYNWAELQPDELALADRLSLRVVTYDGQPGIGLPCSCLDGTRCTVYEQRPRICRDFACSLLLSLRSGAVTLDEALGRVREAHELLHEIESHLPQDSLKRVWDRVSERWDLSDVRQLLAEGKIELDTVMALVGLEVLFENHFRLHDPGGR